MYNFDLLLLITDILMWPLRKVRQISWNVALNQPLYDEYGKMLTDFDVYRYEAQITGQVGSLEYMLNDHYYGDGQLANIYITDGNGSNDTYIYNKAEGRPKTYIYNKAEAEAKTYVYNKNEFSGDPDFIVWIPEALPGTIAGDYSIEMRALVNKYKVAGTTYNIKTYTE